MTPRLILQKLIGGIPDCLIMSLIVVFGAGLTWLLGS
jgi:hypothetical protein